ncbi:MAG: hypothetical protein XD48_0079 [Archaeoglobus fulgidus]|uniref:Uncharacterized protein n=1 Tax=Archaeoglobus fulgidus TaxID=2234 RepID=A0A101E394_ARCFL|nr:MAG: hypothetical protein XD48_0079 [Archaeoglobus fulgidus]
MRHSFHKFIGDLVSATEYTVMKDAACGGDGKLPLYHGNFRFADVDMAIVHDNAVRVIIEIEESGKNPVHIFGKFLASALSTHLSKGIEYYPLESVLFIQIVETSNLDERTGKFEQFEAIEETIRSILPLKGSEVVDYRLLAGDRYDFSAEMGKELIGLLKSHIG